MKCVMKFLLICIMVKNVSTYMNTIPTLFNVYLKKNDQIFIAQSNFPFVVFFYKVIIVYCDLTKCFLNLNYNHFSFMLESTLNILYKGPKAYLTKFLNKKNPLNIIK